MSHSEDGELSFDVNAELEQMGLMPYTVEFVNTTVYHALPLYIAAGKVSPKIFHLVTSPDWFHCEYNSQTRTSQLYLKQGYTFDETGKCFLFVYSLPPRVCYFVNLFPPTTYSDYFEMKEFVGEASDLERYFDGPMCGSKWWDNETNDKILTRLIVRNEGVCVPDFISFVKPFIQKNKVSIFTKAIEQGEMFLLGENDENQIATVVTTILENKEWIEVVVKSSGSRFCGCDGVKFFFSKDVDQIIQYVVDLSKRILPGEGILVDRRVSYKPFEVDGKLIDCCFRVMLARSLKNDDPTCIVSGKTDGILGRFSQWGKPVAVCFGGYFETFDYYSSHVQLSKLQKEELLDGILALGPKVFHGFQNYQITRSLSIDEPKYSQIDFVAVDVCIEERDKRIVPVIVEVNDHDSDGHLFLNKLFPEKQGQSFQTWIQTMITRAELYHQNVSPLKQY